MREYRNTASATEKIIIEYLLENPEQVLSSSVHSLAEKTFSSAPTLFRLCRKLGFDGYKQFRLAIAHELALRRNSTEEAKKEITRMDSLQDIVEKVSYKSIVALEDTKNIIDCDTLANCVELIAKAHTINLFGVGSSLCVAKDAYLKFLRVGKPCIVNDDMHSQLLQARVTNQEDLGIVVSYSGQTVEMLQCINAMRDNNTPIIAITKYGVSPVAELSTYNLYVAANESIFRSGAMSSRICQLNMIDILYTAYLNISYDESLNQFQKTHIYKP